jgi:hypothetical protein
MKRRAVVQADPFAEVGQPDPVTVARHFFQDGEGAANRLNSPANRLLAIVINVAPRIFDETRNRRRASRRSPWGKAGFRPDSTSQNELPIFTIRLRP